MIEYPVYRKVLFCTDFSENADYAFKFAAGIAKRNEAVLYILHVIPENPHQTFVEDSIPLEDMEKIRKGIEGYVAEKFKDNYIKGINGRINFKVVSKTGKEDYKIIEFAKNQNVDLIVMGTHGRTGVAHAIFGSIAEKVLRHSPFPVLIVPCKKKIRD